MRSFFILPLVTAACAAKSLFSPVLQSASRGSSADYVVSQKYAHDKHVTVKYAQPVSVDCSALSSGTEQLQFDHEGQSYNATKTSYKHFRQYGNRHAWTGELADAHGTVTVVWNDKCESSVFHLLVSLTRMSAAGKTVIRSVPASDGTGTWIATLNVDRTRIEHGKPKTKSRHSVPKKADKEIESLACMAKSGVPIKSTNGTVVMPSGRVLDDGSEIRVLFAYTTPTRDRWGRSTIVSMIVGGVASANLAFANSGVGFDIVAARIMHANWTLDSSGQNAALDAMYDGTVPGLATARKRYKADLVQMVVDNGEYCGMANLMGSPSPSFRDVAYSVVYNGCYAGFSHVHEMAHNMGANHDAANSDASVIWPYNHGYRYCNDGSTAPPYFRTIMATGCADAARVPYFSSPNVTYLKKPTGTADADNVRVLQQTRYVVANFMV